jgi:hypothetical protein
MTVGERIFWRDNFLLIQQSQPVLFVITDKGALIIAYSRSILYPSRPSLRAFLLIPYDYIT